MDTETAVPSPTSDSIHQGPAIEVPAQEPTPAPVIPELAPYSADGLNHRIKSMSKDSEARQLQAGKHPFDDAVPGSEKVLIAVIISGETYVALPKIDGGKTMSVSLRCQEATRFTLEVHGLPDGAQIASGNGECGPPGRSGIGFGWSPHHISGYVRILPAQDQEIEVTVISYDDAREPGA